MYKFISEAESKRYRELCSSVLREVQNELAEKGIVTQVYLVGSGAKNMITQNGAAPYDLDYNLEIISADGMYLNDLHRLKETVRNALNHAVGGDDFSDSHDSTSVLTSIRYFTDTPNVNFSFDVAITCRNKQGNLCRLIHNKTAVVFSLMGQYTWNEVPESKGLPERVAKIKNSGKWILLRDRYLELKNQYLSRGDKDHPSFVVYIEAVNEVYQRIIASESKKPKQLAKAQQPVIPKTEFNCRIQKIVATSYHDNHMISQAASLACENYDGKKTKEAVRRELIQNFGKGDGERIYHQIERELKNQ